MVPAIIHLGSDTGMAWLAQCHQVLKIVGTAVFQREDVVDFGSLSVVALASTHLTEGVEPQVTLP